MGTSSVHRAASREVSRWVCLRGRGFPGRSSRPRAQHPPGGTRAAVQGAGTPEATARPRVVATSTGRRPAPSLWVLLALCWAWAAGPAGAQTPAPTTRYVTDQLEAPVRSGKTLENRIVRMLLAGTAVEVLEQDPEGYSRIRGPRGTEGWILTRYLSDTPGARERATRSEARVSELEAETRHLAETLTATREEGQAVERRATELVHANASLQTELDALRKAAERPAELARENEQLREAVARAESAAEALGAEVSLLRDGGYRRWFLTGGGVALGGVILGLVLPRLATRRKRSGWDRL